MTFTERYKLDNSKDSGKKVAIIITGSNRALDDFGNRPEKEARYLREKGFQLKVFILQNKVFGNETIENIINGFNVAHFIGHSEKKRNKAKSSGRTKLLKIYYILLGVRFIFWLRKQLRNEHYDYLQCHNMGAMLAGYLAREKRTKLVFVMREFYEGQGKKKYLIRVFTRKTLNHLLKVAYKVEYVVPFQYEKMQGKIKDKAVYIPNYAEIESIPPLQKEQSPLIRINCIGNIRDRKSLLMLLNACKNIKQVQVGLYGRFADKNLEAELKENYPEVFFFGEYKYTDSNTIYSKTDILFCSYNPAILNNKIGRPTKVFEAIITTTPVIMPLEMDITSMIIKEDFGWGFAYNEEGALEKLITHIVDNKYEIEEKAKSIGMKQNQYTWESIIERLDEVFV